MSEQTTSKRARGKGKKAALTHINLRVPTHIVEYYKATSANYTGKMREVLTQFVEQHKPQDPDT
jgi:uncharacterized protein (DUF4415 family)